MRLPEARLKLSTLSLRGTGIRGPPQGGFAHIVTMTEVARTRAPVESRVDEARIGVVTFGVRCERAAEGARKVVLRQALAERTVLRSNGGR